MHISTIRQVVDWLQHPEKGVNALRLTVPRDGDIPAPPVVVAVRDATRHGFVARRTIDAAAVKSGPILVVGPVERDEVDTEVALAALAEYERTRTLVSVRYAAKGDLTEKLYVQGHLTLRCALRAVALQCGLPLPERDMVHFGHDTVGAFVTTHAALEGTTLVGELLLSIPAIDAWALGAPIDP